MKLISLVHFVLFFICTAKMASGWCLKSTQSQVDKVEVVEYSPDGTMIGIALTNKAVKIYDALTMALKMQFSVPGAPKCLKFNNAGTILAAASVHANIVLANIAAGTTSNLASGQNQVYSLDFNSDSSFMLSCGKDAQLKLWNTASWPWVANTPAFTNTATQFISCEFTSTGTIIVGDALGSVKTYTSPFLNANAGAGVTYGGNQFVAIANRYTTADYIAIENNNKKLFASLDNSNAVYTTAGGKPIRTCSYSRSLDYFMIGTDEKKVIFFNATNKNGSLVQSISSTGNVLSSDFSNDGAFLVVGFDNDMFSIYQRSCLTCSSIQFFNQTSKVCQLCSIIQGCGACYNGSTCGLCNQGYYLTTTKTCTQCFVPMPGCAVCTNSSFCTTALPGHYITAGNLPATCESAMIGCLICNSSSICLQCHNQFYLASNKCQSCSLVTNCLKCYNNSYCTQCQAGYYPTSGTTTSSCSRCATNCLDCQSLTQCFQCVVGYYTTGSTCQSCSSNCLACNNTGFCLDCATNYFISSGSCSACTAPCLTCVTTATTCQSCIPGYYFDGTSQCILCSTGCQTCTGTGTTACLTCIQGYYYVSANTSCVKCNATYPNCQSCNTTNCHFCLTSFYYDSAAAQANQCKSCVTQMHGCILCTSATACSFCSPGHYLSTLSGNDSCQPCALGCTTCENSTNCTSCSPGYYFDSVAYTCPKCSSKCSTCTSPTYCLSCIIGYYLSSIGTCTACNATKSYCLACLYDSSNTLQCIQCGVGFFLNSGSCSRCDSNCVTCNASLACLSCQLGFYLNTTDSTCKTCSPSCAECSTNGTCQSCHVGYYLSGTGCLACTGLGCLSCRPDLKCLSCVTGYYLVSATNLCQMCSVPLGNCIVCTSPTVCTQCAYGYALTVSGANTTCSSCSTLTGCFHCTNLANCLACQSGYYLDGSNQCASCPEGCRNCLNGTYCSSCVSSYFSGNIIGGANNGLCLKCQNYLAGCDICQNNTDCITCASGYYLGLSGSNSVCNLCEINITSCTVCNSSTICTSCKGGYYLASNSLSCIQCSTTFQACQLCDRLGTACTDCQSGYYLNGGNCLLCSNNLPGCRVCNGNTTCLECGSGYYLNGSNCALCSSALPGCIFCSNSSICLQCQGGYYLASNNFTCLPCQTVGCQICLQSAPSSCLTCNSLYYKSSTTVCSLCSVPLPGCQTCPNSTACSRCQVGYYLTTATPPTCSLCSLALTGCSICSSPGTCLQCKSMYFLNSSSSCQICSTPMTGCTFCTNGTICLSCGAGYFLNSSGLCQSCTDITGCLVCKNSTTCLFCDTGFYFSNFTCLSCSSITGCYSCISSTVCTSCVGGYTLNSNSGCDVAQVQANKEVTDIFLKTLYENENTLKHYMYVKNMNYTKATIDWTTNARLFLLSPNNTQINLTIVKAQWSTQNSYTVIFWTNNPIDYKSSTKKMPFTRLLQQSLDLSNTKTGIELTQTAMQQILPLYQHSGSLLIDYNLNNAEFYSSYGKNYAPSEFPFYVIGIAISGVLALKFGVKALATAPRSINAGNIIPHILCFKVGALLLFPTYLEYISYCTGFMYVDLPFLNWFFGGLFADHRDVTPEPYKYFYSNMNFGSMYLLAFCVFVLLVIITVLVGKSCSPKYDYKMNAFLQFLYNFFVFGLAFAGCASLQGAIKNPMTSLNINGVFYILGILVYFSLLCECIYKLSKDKSANFFKLRIMVKATLLSISHQSPIYLLSSAVLIDIVLIIVQLQLSEYAKTYCKYWVFSNVILNVSLILLVFLPIIQLTMVLVSVCIFLAILAEAIIHYYEAKQKTVMTKIESTRLKDDDNIWDLNVKQKQDFKKDMQTHQNFFDQTRANFKADENDKMQTMYNNNKQQNGKQIPALNTKYKRQRNYKKVREENKDKLLNMQNSNRKAKQNGEYDNQQAQYPQKDQNLTFVVDNLNFD